MYIITYHIQENGLTLKRTQKSRDVNEARLFWVWGREAWYSRKRLQSQMSSRVASNTGCSISTFIIIIIIILSYADVCILYRRYAAAFCVSLGAHFGWLLCWFLRCCQVSKTPARPCSRAAIVFLALWSLRALEVIVVIWFHFLEKIYHLFRIVLIAWLPWIIGKVLFTI